MCKEMTAPQPGEPNERDGAAARSAKSVFDSDRLFEGRNEIQIRHAGQTYRLRITCNDKLILTK